MNRTDLVNKVKNYLDITWEDDKINDKIAGITNRAIRVLQSYAGKAIVIEKDSDEEQLLLDLCRYIYNNAYEDFKNNFSSELIMLRTKYQCDRESENDEQEKNTII